MKINFTINVQDTWAPRSGLETELAISVDDRRFSRTLLPQSDTARVLANALQDMALEITDTLYPTEGTITQYSPPNEAPKDSHYVVLESEARSSIEGSYCPECGRHVGERHVIGCINVTVEES